MAEAIAHETEGFVDVGGGRIWYQAAGEGPRALLLLHGGPGGSSGDLAPLMALAGDGWRVVRYDQLGSRRSDQPDYPALWRVPRFVAEVETVRRRLGLGRMHLLGQSWGAILAIEYALHHGANLRSLTLASGAASITECVAGMNRWRDALPAETRATMARHEASGDYQHPAYLAAVEVLYRRHLCRLWPYPQPLAEAMANMAKPVYHSMWGPNEFTCTGSLRNWDRSDRLGEIAVPTLITAGEFDEVHPSCAETLHRGIAGSEKVVFEGCSHTAHLEDTPRYLGVVRGFLARVDATLES